VVVPFQKRICLVLNHFYKVIGCHDGVSFALKRMFGRTKVPLMVAFFVWSTTLGKILIMDNL
jgi:hypothetical protein